MSEQDQTWSEVPEAPELETPPPAWPKVIGIISIVWASIGLLCNAIGAVSMPFMSGLARSIQEQAGASTPPPSMQFGGVDYAMVALGLIASILLLVAGIMTVSRNAGGRSTHLVYAFLALGVAVIGVYIQLGKQAEMQQWVKDEVTDPDLAKAIGNQLGAWIGLAFGLLLGTAWPLFCIIWFGAAGKRPEVGKPEVL